MNFSDEGGKEKAMGSSGGGRTQVAQQPPIYTYAGGSGGGTSSTTGSVTSAVAKTISTGAEAQTEAQAQARRRSSGIASTFKRFLGNDSTSGKSKLGQ